MSVFRSLLLFVSWAAVAFAANGQDFIHIHPHQCVVVDSIPLFTTELRPSLNSKSGYHVELLYPEYRELVSEERQWLPAIKHRSRENGRPVLKQTLLADRKSHVVSVSFCPIVKKDGRWMAVASCQLRLVPNRNSALRTQSVRLSTSERWTDSSVLSQGKWTKIRVKEEGIYRLSPELLRRMGFSHPERVKVYGYGGKLQSEIFAFDVEAETVASNRVPDDLVEVPTLRRSDYILFWAEGTQRRTYHSLKKRWTHVNNFYSDYSYYFITEGDNPLSVDTLARTTSTPAATLDRVPYAAILDRDEAGLYEGGRRLFDRHDFAQGNSYSFKLKVIDADTASLKNIPVSIAWAAASTSSSTTAEFKINDELLGRDLIGTYYSLTESAKTHVAEFLHDIRPGENVIGMTTTRGNTARLDYITLNYERKLTVSESPYAFSPQTTGVTAMRIANAGPDTHIWRIGQTGSPTVEIPFSGDGENSALFVTDTPQRRFVAFDASRTYPTPEVVGSIANQNLHGDSDIDYIIVIPQSRKLTAQAERLAEIHREREKMNVKVIPVDQIYNEFSSGTPDANGIRRYLKMLYDRAGSASKAPRYLLFMGRSAWDNRLLTEQWKSEAPEDFLPAYEFDASEQSIGTVSSFVTDDFFGLLDDEEGRNINAEKIDLAIGRMVCSSEDEARILVDKVERYLKNEDAGAWKNDIVVMADDGDAYEHTRDAENVSKAVGQTTHNRLMLEKVYWDSYNKEAGTTGLTYPVVSALLKQKITSGAAIFNYSGHGSPTILSHEKVLVLDDFKRVSAPHLALWVLASCEIFPFDSREANLADVFLLRPDGGAVSFMCATRAVYAKQNNALNVAFSRHLLGKDDQGNRTTMGEALRLAKNELVADGSDATFNKMKYLLFGDPALVLSIPTGTVVVDSIDGQLLTADTHLQLSAGQVVRFSGHVVSANSSLGIDESFNGTLSADIYDRNETRTCKDNDGSAKKAGVGALSFSVSGHRIFRGTTRVDKGRYTIRAVIPRDISYSTDSARISLYAVSDDKQTECNGFNRSFYLKGTSTQLDPDTLGPTIVAYLNEVSTPEYGIVGSNSTLVADISDESGINIAGTSIGHDIELSLDGGEPVVLNDYFTYSPDSYNKGQVVYHLSSLAPGLHRMSLRVWDVNNNSTTAQLAFVVSGKSRDGLSLYTTSNPAVSFTTFIAGFPVLGDDGGKIKWEVYDLSGRKYWRKVDELSGKSGVASTAWNLRSDDGQLLPAGIYVVRVAVKGGGEETLKGTMKLVILNK